MFYKESSKWREESVDIQVNAVKGKGNSSHSTISRNHSGKVVTCRCQKMSLMSHSYPTPLKYRTKGLPLHSNDKRIRHTASNRVSSRLSSGSTAVLGRRLVHTSKTSTPSLARYITANDSRRDEQHDCTCIDPLSWRLVETSNIATRFGSIASKISPS